MASRGDDAVARLAAPAIDLDVDAATTADVNIDVERFSHSSRRLAQRRFRFAGHLNASRVLPRGGSGGSWSRRRCRCRAVACSRCKRQWCRDCRQIHESGILHHGVPSFQANRDLWRAFLTFPRCNVAQCNLSQCKCRAVVRRRHESAKPGCLTTLRNYHRATVTIRRRQSA
jgi:hypothetical protein